MKHSYIPFRLPSYSTQSVLPAILSVAIRPSDLVLLCQKYYVPVAALNLDIGQHCVHGQWSRPLNQRTDIYIKTVLANAIVQQI